MSPTTATSCALQCPELLRLICKQIGTDDKWTLSRLYLTCRSFMEPALDELWYKLDNLDPLVRCMDNDLVERVKKKGVVTLSFQRSMLASDWERFEVAAARVRVLEYSSNPRAGGRFAMSIYKLDCSIFRSFACAARGRTGLLPRLQELTWTAIDDEIYPYISLFLSPTITSLEIDASGKELASERMRFSLLESLASQCPSLRSLKLRGGPGLDGQVTSWRILFSRYSANACASFGLWKTLSSLCLDHIDLRTLTEVLATLPALMKLKLSCCQTITDLPLAPSRVQGFPVLQHLCMEDCDMDSCLYVLKRMSYGTPLVHLELSFKGLPSEYRWHELFNNMTAVISHDSLSIVHFSVTDPILDEGEQEVLMDFQTISPLLHFRHISEFKHTGFCFLDFDDGDVALIARAWPHLKSFIISHARLQLTLRAFLPFVKYCPELEVLGMKIDVTNVDDYEERPARGSLGTGLRELMIFDSPIDDPPRVAAFISDIFPKVARIDFTTFKSLSVSTEYQTHWTNWIEVERLIPIFAAVRGREANHTS
ncbi:hypothetical protein F5887DRAFT_914557 [Amanita rubescens]|nr:hypothetical protein F5887DRAFT_914557 [Amanita rubescens]